MISAESVARTLKNLRTSQGDYWITQLFSSIVSLFKMGTSLKAAYSVTMKIFRKIFFSFEIICKSRIKLCFHNKNIQYS